jgi:hypothetical protein
LTSVSHVCLYIPEPEYQRAFSPDRQQHSNEMVRVLLSGLTDLLFEGPRMNSEKNISNIEKLILLIQALVLFANKNKETSGIN